MKKLTIATTKQLIKFLDLLGDCDSLEYTLGDHPSMLIEKGRGVKIEEGNGFLFSIGLILDKQKGTYEFKMEFIVIDQRIKAVGKGRVLAYPVSFQDDIAQVSEESCAIRGNHIEHVNPATQKNHVKLAYKWLHDLVTDGYTTRPEA